MVSLPAFDRRKVEKLIWGVLLGTLFLLFWTLEPRFLAYLSGENNLSVYFYDVGQGDAALIQKGSVQILIDGGPDARILTDLGRYLLPWDREIELLILTHPQADHMSGLTPVIERYQVDKILYFPSVYDTAGYKKFQEAVKKEGSEVLWAQSGGEVSFGGFSLQVIWPTANFHGTDVNEESVVALLDYQDFEVLFLGDAEKNIQDRLLVNDDIELLKVSHHGAANGSSERLLRAVTPDLAVISVGAKNRYGHPHQQTLDLFANLRIPILRTDLNGTVTIRSNGRDFWYSSDR